ncbi:hypothetical protein GCM10010177_44040 [Actinomadura citrea]|nr:hypothetical protein GCM10010177_44040 [Actinomadura citrea]
MSGPFPGPTPRAIGRLRPDTAPDHRAGSGGHDADHWRDPRPRRGAAPGGPSGGRSVSPVLDCSKTTGFRHLVNRRMFCGYSMLSQLNTMIRAFGDFAGA